MNRIKIIATALFVATVYQASLLDAQERWSIELRGSGAISTQDAVRETHEKGLGLGGNVQYGFLPHFAAYAGWDHAQFSALEAIAGSDMELVESGYVLGLRFEHPIRDGGRTKGWVRSGATYKRLELESSDGEVIDDSGHGFGWEFGAGLTVPLLRRWSVTPGIRYRSISRDVAFDGTTRALELRSVAFEIGFIRHF